MSVSVLQHSSSLDPFLRQAAPLLQTYWNAISKITNQHLMIERKMVPSPEPIMGQGLHITIEISVPVQFVVGEERRKMQESRKAEQVRSTAEALAVVELVSLYSHKLGEVINAELKFQEEFKEQGRNLQLRVKKLKNLCKALEEFSQVVDEIMDIYAKKSLGFHIQACLPSLLEDLKEKKKMIQTLKSQIKFDEFHPLFEKYTEQFKTTDENILCDILGVNGEVGDHLFEMDVDMRMHETDLYFLKKYIENKEDEMESAGGMLETAAGKETLLINLQKLGFTENCADTITSSIPDEFVDLQKPSFWGIRYLEHSFAHHPLIHNFNLPRYPFSEDTMDSWFTQEISTEKRDEPEESESYDKENWAVKMINMSSSNPRSKTLVHEFLKEQEQDESSQLLFHGTSHQSALSILQEGITLSKGSDSQDFSSGDGFYLSELFENAEKWRRGSMASHHAVIIFKVDSSLIDADREGGLDLSRNKNQWEEVVKLCRSGYRDKKAKRRLLKDVKFIRGPLCVNPKEFEHGGRFVGFGRNDSIQVCLRDENFASRVGSLANISGVIFY